MVHSWKITQSTIVMHWAKGKGSFPAYVYGVGKTNYLTLTQWDLMLFLTTLLSLFTDRLSPHFPISTLTSSCPAEKWLPQEWGRDGKGKHDCWKQSKNSLQSHRLILLYIIYILYICYIIYIIYHAFYLKPLKSILCSHLSQVSEISLNYFIFKRKIQMKK